MNDRPMLKKQKRLYNRETDTYVDVPENGGVIQRPPPKTLGKKKTRKFIPDKPSPPEE